MAVAVIERWPLVEARMYFDGTNPLLEKVSSYSLLARFWLLDEPSFFLLRGMTGLIILLFYVINFRQLLLRSCCLLKQNWQRKNKTSLSPAMLLVSRNPISSGPSPMELCRQVEMG